MTAWRPCIIVSIHGILALLSRGLANAGGYNSIWHVAFLASSAADPGSDRDGLPDVDSLKRALRLACPFRHAKARCVFQGTSCLPIRERTLAQARMIWQRCSSTYALLDPAQSQRRTRVQLLGHAGSAPTRASGNRQPTIGHQSLEHLLVKASGLRVGVRESQLGKVRSFQNVGQREHQTPSAGWFRFPSLCAPKQDHHACILHTGGFPAL